MGPTQQPYESLPSFLKPQQVRSGCVDQTRPEMVRVLIVLPKVCDWLLGGACFVFFMHKLLGFSL